MSDYTTTALAVEPKTQPTVTEFLAPFFADANEPIYLRSFKPKGAPDTLNNKPERYSVTRARLAVDRRIQGQLKKHNLTRGLYFLPNAGGNTDDSITRFNAFFVENDTLTIAEQHAKLDAAPIQPSVRVETRKSVHAYWLIDGDCSEAEWTDLQLRLIAYFDGDKTIKNPSRCMRLPHFDHVTYDEGNGYSYKTVNVAGFAPERRYTVADMQAAFPAVVMKQEAGGQASHNNTSSTSPPLDRSDPHADLKRLIVMVAGKPNKRGNYEIKCPVHGGKTDTSLVLLSSGAFKCLAGCTTADLRQAFGLPKKSNSSLSSPEAIAASTNLSSPDSLLSPANGNDSKTAERLTFPQLDRKALFGLAGDYVRAVYPHTEADESAILLQLLVGFGNIAGRTAYYVADGARHYTNLYALLIGKTSAAKGSALAHVKNLLFSVDENWAQHHVVRGLSSGEGLIKAVDDASHPIDKRLFVVESEFASVLQNFKRDGNKLSPILRGLWDDGSAASMTVKDSVATTNAHVSIVGHITPEEQQKALGSTEIANGFANRFLFASVRRSKDLPDGGSLPKAELNTLAMRFLKAVQFAQTVGEMKRDVEAGEYWNAVYPRLVEDKPGAFGKVVARARPQVLRLSCIYALLDCSAVVKRVHLEAALALWQYCEDSARYVFGNENVLTPDAQKLLDALQRSSNAGLNRTEQHKVFSGKRRSDELDVIQSELLQAGLVHADSIATNGRTEERLFADSVAQKGSERSEESEIGDVPINNFLCEACEERAAIMVADGGLTADEAERLARQQCPTCTAADDYEEFLANVSSAD